MGHPAAGQPWSTRAANLIAELERLAGAAPSASRRGFLYRCARPASSLSFSATVRSSSTAARAGTSDRRRS
jgi:hypothetical protein